MKLNQINEGMLGQQLREVFGPAYFAKPGLQATQSYNSDSGADQSSRAVAPIQTPAGIPKKARHRSYFGLERRPGTIRL